MGFRTTWHCIDNFFAKAGGMPMRVPSLSEKETKEANTSVSSQEKERTSADIFRGTCPTTVVPAISYHCYRVRIFLVFEFSFAG